MAFQPPTETMSAKGSQKAEEFVSHVPVCCCILHLVLQSRRELVIRYACARCFVPSWSSPKAALSCLVDYTEPPNSLGNALK